MVLSRLQEHMLYTCIHRFKGSRQLEEGPRISMSSEGNRYRLCILDSQGEDEDDYSVKATTPAGSRVSRAKVVIRCKQDTGDRYQPDSTSLPPSLPPRSEEHTSELQSRSHISYAVFCLKKKKQ